MERYRFLATQEDVQQEKQRESLYEEENQFLTQSVSWREGMRYRYSPDSYPLTAEQIESMTKAGEGFGTTLENLYGENIVEFRLDFVKSIDNRLLVTEVQTDDRGLPAIAIARNMRRTSSDCFLGVEEALDAALRNKLRKDGYSLAIVYPDDERFYYAGFNDLSTMMWAVNPKAEILVVTENQLDITSSPSTFKPSLTLPLVIEPDLFWDFTEKYSSSFQSRVSKKLLQYIWELNPGSADLRTYVPEVTSVEDPRVSQEKEEWILKPENGRWSRGIVIGRETVREQWTKAITQPDLVAQKFIPPATDWLRVRKEWFDKKNRRHLSYPLEPLYARVEGYYFKLSEGWILGDVLATCTPTIPVHGKRDCIMIPGTMNPNPEEAIDVES